MEWPAHLPIVGGGGVTLSISKIGPFVLYSFIGCE